MVATGLFFLLATATSPVRVVDDGCPSGEEVELALGSMLTASGVTPEKQDVAKLQHGPDRLHVERFSFRDSISLIYSAKDQKLKAERQPMRLSQLPVRMHFRGGYRQPGFGNKFWGFLVDVACAGIIIWVVSGLVMWWRLPRLRTWGTIAVAAGILSFTLLVGTL